eukprot:7839460-Pyramimonas_sp.AAC.1
MPTYVHTAGSKAVPALALPTEEPPGKKKGEDSTRSKAKKKDADKDVDEKDVDEDDQDLPATGPLRYVREPAGQPSRSDQSVELHPFYDLFRPLTGHNIRGVMVICRARIPYEGTRASSDRSYAGVDANDTGRRYGLM